MSDQTVDRSPLHYPRFLWWILAGVMLLAIAARMIPEPRTIDDAFITFRYSRNLVDGNGFVYNPGSRTLGTTTPLYTLLMAGISLVTGSENFPWFALITNATADAITAVLLSLLLFRATQRIALAAIMGTLWAISPMSVTFAIGGMETSVGILWAVAAIYAYATYRERWMAVFAALAILTRIDTIIWVGLLFLHQLYTRWRKTRDVTGGSLLRIAPKRLPWASWLIFGAILLPWYGFSWAYFGTILSRSLSAKQVAYIVGDLQAATRLIQHIATPFFDYDALGIPGIVIGMFLYPALAAAGTLYAAKNHPRLVPYLVYPWFYVAIFSLMNPLIFRWYLAPILPAYFLAILLGVWALGSSLAEQFERSRVLPAAFSIIGLIFILFSLNAWTLNPDHGPDRPAPEMAWHKIELNYRQMGEKLRDEYGVTEDTLVAVGDIGAVGFFSRARILDTVGLVTPEISDYYPFDKNLLAEGANYAVPPAIIHDYQPAYIVLMEHFVRLGLAVDPLFNAQYAEVWTIPTDYYGSGMILYQRRDLATAD